MTSYRRIYYDTEFVELGNRAPIVPISIAMIDDDGWEAYGINHEIQLALLENHAGHRENTVPLLPVRWRGAKLLWDTKHPDANCLYTTEEMGALVHSFCLPYDDRNHNQPPELWAYYAAYDHVVLSQLFGTMTQLPPGMPMYTNDLMQELRSRQYPKSILPSFEGNAHDPRADALFVRRSYQYIQNVGIE